MTENQKYSQTQVIELIKIFIGNFSNNLNYFKSLQHNFKTNYIASFLKIGCIKYEKESTKKFNNKSGMQQKCFFLSPNFEFKNNYLN